jgi:hypothetical protein
MFVGWHRHVQWFSTLTKSHDLLPVCAGVAQFLHWLVSP